ncbi:hypothetical protein AOQ84DRAFT_18336 [Glonium stellatum]|uniref:Uncharacterized protein n=1 Tax=Glonium stellatum TaxID=574774 RepID=A0A8E2JLA5_9PEZI|nr:hypothetical protein AOQ84DRAFT_18336 [Glonium stellatum]
MSNVLFYFIGKSEPSIHSGFFLIPLFLSLSFLVRAHAKAPTAAFAYSFDLLCFGPAFAAQRSRGAYAPGGESGEYIM